MAESLHISSETGGLPKLLVFFFGILWPRHLMIIFFLYLYGPANQRMVERAQTATPVRIRDGVSSLRLSFLSIGNLRLFFSGRGIHVIWTHF